MHRSQEQEEGSVTSKYPATPCVECGASDRTVMLAQEAIVLGKKCEWRICVQCFLMGELEAPKRAAEESR